MEILVKPLLTEKGAALNASDKYGFVVNKKANKFQIKKEIESRYGVVVLNINTMIAPGKAKTRYTKGGVVSGRTSSFKKAIVTLKEGDIIDFYSTL
jgi:large subunit ribosomal protein L23